MSVDTTFTPNDPEQAFSLNNGDYYLSIQEGDGYYDYTIYRADFTEYDGGQLDEPDMTIQEATEAILKMFDLSDKSCQRIDYDDLQESVYEVEMRHPVLKSLLERADSQKSVSSFQSPAKNDFERDR